MKVTTQHLILLVRCSCGFAITSGRKIKMGLPFFCSIIVRVSMKSKNNVRPRLGFCYGILVLIIYLSFVFPGSPPLMTTCTCVARSIISNMNLHLAVENPISLRCL